MVPSIQGFDSLHGIAPGAGQTNMQVNVCTLYATCLYTCMHVLNNSTTGYTHEVIIQLTTEIYVGNDRYE